MDTLETRSVSRSAAGCSPIVLREGNQVRLVFVPKLVDNPENPKACVDGHFIYQRKTRNGPWLPVPTVPLTTFKSGEEFRLMLHAQELRTLLEGVVRLYQLHQQLGIPRGSSRFVRVDPGVAEFFARGRKDLVSILDSDAENAVEMMLQFVRWLARSPGRREAVTKLASVAPEQMPTLTALLSLAAMKDAIGHWRQNQTNGSEEFWQRSLTDRAYVLSQVFAYPVVVIDSRAYVGGKRLAGGGGKETDFLATIESTQAVIVIEIKTPQTKLLGPQYRDGVFPLSRELSAAIAQALRCRQNLMRRFDALTAEVAKKFTLGEPRCVVIAGNSTELRDQVMRENFELQREHVHGATIVTYDELFLRLERLVALLEVPF